MESGSNGRATPGEGALRWRWVVVGLLLGALLIGAFLFLVDRQVQRPVVAGFASALALILSGVVVGALSPGETIREAAIVGFLLFLASGTVAVTALGLSVPTLMWLVAPMYAAALSSLGGWVGEMLQGTLTASARDEAIDWPWVIVSVVIGLTLSTFSVLVASARFGVAAPQSLWIFAVSFLATGVFIGYFSPGRTLVEPAIAAGLMTIVNVGFVIAWYGDLPLGEILLIASGGGIVLALVGGWIGERLQDAFLGRAEAG